MSSDARRDIIVDARDDLPAYRLRTSRRARQVRLTVTAREGLIVIVPESLAGYDPTDALRERRAWIEESLAHFSAHGETLRADAASRLPAHVEFAATGEAWPVRYAPTSSARVMVLAREGALEVRGATEDAEACLAALRRWLQRSARERLLPALEREASAAGVAYAKAGVRGQRDRWGGCSERGTITLNRALLFLEPALVRAVMLHELAHLAHPDHSPAFWNELRRLDPQADAHREAIAAAWDRVPAWAES